MTRSQGKLLIIVLAFLGVAVVALWLPLTQYTVAVVDYVRDAGAMGVVLYGGIYVVATVFMIPGSLLTIFAGLLYGLGGGLLLVWPASLIGATLAFVIGRFFARDWVTGLMSENRRARAVDDAIGSRAFSIIFLLRLSPLMPFTLLNYVLGVTRAKLGSYFLASATGMLPGTVLYVYIGSLATDAVALASGTRPTTGVWGQVLLVAGLVATVVVTVVISRMAGARLREQIAE